MPNLPAGLDKHRLRAADLDGVCRGDVRYAPSKSLWFLGMTGAALIGAPLTFTLGVTQ